MFLFEKIKALTSFKLSKASLNKLQGVHPHIVAVVERAIQITQIDFKVTEGLRTLERQKQLLAQKATTTLKSRHLTGHAVDLCALVNNQVSFEYKYYPQIADAMKRAAQELDIVIEWGGDWKTFKDGMHFQLPWSVR
ncbi:M15 family metallopeptidase [Acinetobacter sp. B5B]|uniref:M15 family metallopeptidase n=1 Tax=Acinetobacter baretiae TaxID=2605383 RepID=UPI0018C31326|nr:M15 family metallopeptidase [Acinetobacter baretiae]MBF7683934.1 M15 family metallopeptidase [Acinetobacter baretiae]